MLVNAFITAAALAATTAYAQTINTPAALIECQPAALSWSGGQTPYYLAVIPGGQASAAALETLVDASSATSYTWTVNLAAGTSITLKLTDGTGAIAYSSPLSIQSGSSQSCFNTTATSAAGAAGVVGSATSAASVSSAAGSASSVSSAAAVTASSASSAAVSSASKASSSAAGASSSGAASASSGSSAAKSSTSTSAGASTPVSSAAAATSSKSAGERLAAPGLLLAAVGGLFALF